MVTIKHQYEVISFESISISVLLWNSVLVPSDFVTRRRVFGSCFRFNHSVPIGVGHLTCSTHRMPRGNFSTKFDCADRSDPPGSLNDTDELNNRRDPTYFKNASTFVLSTAENLPKKNAHRILVNDPQPSWYGRCAGSLQIDSGTQNNPYVLSYRRQFLTDSSWTCLVFTQAVSIAEGLKRRSGVCASVCVLSCSSSTSSDASVNLEPAANVRFVPIDRGPLYLY